MKTLIECILAVTIFIILFVLLLRVFGIILDMTSAVDRDQYLQLKFSQFKKFYSINPGKYDLCDHTVIRRDSYKSGFPTHKIKFNIIDTLRYMHFKKEIEKNRANDYMNNKMKEYLNFVQNDIDELNQKAQEEIEKAKREVGK